MKLIKIEKHYYVIGDNDIKEGSYWIYICPINGIDYGENNVPIIKNNLDSSWFDRLHDKKNYFKITHSTQQLEGVTLLSLSDVEEAIYGYNIKKLAIKKYPICDEFPGRWFSSEGFIEGFKACQELMKDKLFTVEDMEKAIEMAREESGFSDNTMSYDYDENDIIQSFLPKTEWEIEIQDNKIKVL